MSHPSQNTRVRSESKRGIATLELVMCMPVLLVLMIGIVWLGYSVIGQSAVTVDARYKAWDKRFDEGESEALRFLDDDFATEESTEEINISPLFDDVSPPESSHDVAIGPWDHNKVDLNRFPNWELYLTAAANAKTGGLQNAYSDARNDLTQLQNIAGQLVIEEIENIIRDMLRNPLDNFLPGAGSEKDKQEAEAEAKKAQLKQSIADTEREIEQTEDHIDELKQQEGDAEGDEKESIESRIKIAKNKLKRLKAKRKRLKSDLKEAG